MKKILLIEDTHTIRENIAEFLEIRGHEVVEATNGKEGWELLKTEAPCLVICDVKMPQMDGFQIKSQANQVEKIKDIPFIFLSAAAQKADIAKGQSLGAITYLTKPFDMNELLEWVDKA